MNYYDTHDMKIELEICDMSSSFSSHIWYLKAFRFSNQDSTVLFILPLKIFKVLIVKSLIAYKCINFDHNQSQTNY